MPENIEDQLRKIRARLDSPHPGEAENARRLLERIAKKHGLDLDGLEPEPLIDRKYYARDARRRNLLFHLAGVACDWRDDLQVGYRGRDVWILATEREHARIQTLKDVHEPALDDHLTLAHNAYLQTNRLAKPCDGDPLEGMTPEELAELEKLWGMMQSMDETHVPTAQIERGGS